MTDQVPVGVRGGYWGKCQLEKRLDIKYDTENGDSWLYVTRS